MQMRCIVPQAQLSIIGLFIAGNDLMRQIRESFNEVGISCAGKNKPQHHCSPTKERDSAEDKHWVVSSSRAAAGRVPGQIRGEVAAHLPAAHLCLVCVCVCVCVCACVCVCVRACVRACVRVS